MLKITKLCGNEHIDIHDTKIRDVLRKLKRGDIILTEDLGGNEELCEVTCNDNDKLWTKGVLDKTEAEAETEICETYVELVSEYKSIHLITGDKKSE